MKNTLPYDVRQRVFCENKGSKRPRFFGIVFAKKRAKTNEFSLFFIFININANTIMPYLIRKSFPFLEMNTDFHILIFES